MRKDDFQSLQTLLKAVFAEQKFMFTPEAMKVFLDYYGEKLQNVIPYGDDIDNIEKLQSSLNSFDENLEFFITNLRKFSSGPRFTITIDILGLSRYRIVSPNSLRKTIKECEKRRIERP